MTKLREQSFVGRILLTGILLNNLKKLSESLALCDKNCDCGCCDKNCDCGCCDKNCDCGCCDKNCDCGCQSGVEMCDKNCDCGCCDKNCDCGCCDKDCDCGCHGGESCNCGCDCGCHHNEEGEANFSGGDDGDDDDDKEKQCHCDCNNGCSCESERNLANEYLNLARQIQADFDNYRRRNNEAVKQAKAEGIKEAVMNFLPALDAIERAMPFMQDEQSREGINMIRKLFEKSFENFKIEPIKCVGTHYDPNFHDVVFAEESEFESGTIIEEIEVGYTMDGKVIRHSVVKIAK